MDLSNIHPDHRELVQSILSDEFGVGYTEEQKQQLFNTYVKLNKIPKKDWNKESTKERIAGINENTSDLNA